MVSQAWPFLIGRSRNQGHRIIAIPEFMANPAGAAALRDATGITDRTPDTPILREVQGLALGPVSVVYRSFLLHGSDYGLGDDAILTDDSGRPIRLIEGLAFRLPEAALQELGITEADLGRAHAEVTAAYQAFWSAGIAFARHVSGPLPVGQGDRGSTIALTSAEPWVVRGKDVPAPAALTESTPGEEPASAPPAHRVNVAVLLLLALVLAVIALLILLIVHLVSPSHPAQRSLPASRTSFSRGPSTRASSRPTTGPRSS